VNDEDKDELTIYIGMKPRINTSIQFNILSASATGHKNKLKQEGTNVKATLVSTVPHG
jgi:hypothetical protein